MLPTLEPGQRILVNRFSHHVGGDPKLGDVTVFLPPQRSDDRHLRPPRRGPDVRRRRTGDPPLLLAGRRATHSDTAFVKRVVGLPGDTIAIINGHVIRNGKPAEEPFASDCSGAVCTLNPIKIPPGSYFLMGDNRGDSEDSRFWGPVPRDWIIGKAVVSFWPPSDLGTL